MKTTLRSIVVVAATAVLSGAVVLAACGFPSPVLSDELGDAAGDAGAGSNLTDASQGDVVVGDPTDPGAEIAQDAGQKVDAAGCTDKTCDCDGDGFKDFTKDGCGPPEGVDAGFGDCDDTDTRLRPNQRAYFQETDPPNNGDWNCNRSIEHYWKNAKLDCSNVAIDACATAEGFQGDPACGEKGLYIFCKKVPNLGGVLGYTCGVDADRTTENIQACR